MSIETQIQSAVENALAPHISDIENIINGLKSSAPEVMTLDQVCAYTHYTRQTIRSFIKNKAFPVSRPNSSPRFLKSEVDKWLKQQL